MKLREIENSEYYVADDGRVYTTKSGDVKRLYPSHTARGYETFVLRTDNGILRKMGHRLVAENFIDNPEGKPFVNHINGIVDDNRVSNLEWVTHQENVDHAVRTGLFCVEGEKNPSNKYSEESIHEVCRLLTKNRYTSIEIEERTGVSHKVISLIRLGKVWTEVTSQYDIGRKNNTKLDDDIVIKICHYINRGVPYKQIEKIFDYPVRYIREIAKCRRYKAIAKKYIQQPSTTSREA